MTPLNRSHSPIGTSCSAQPVYSRVYGAHHMNLSLRMKFMDVGGLFSLSLCELKGLSCQVYSTLLYQATLFFSPGVENKEQSEDVPQTLDITQSTQSCDFITPASRLSSTQSTRFHVNDVRKSSALTFAASMISYHVNALPVEITRNMRRLISAFEIFLASDETNSNVWLNETAGQVATRIHSPST
jgi:hypothetical protein